MKKVWIIKEKIIIVFVVILVACMISPNMIIHAETEKNIYYMGETQKKNDAGYKKDVEMKSSDFHNGWRLGQFCISGWTRRTTDDNGNPVFLKNVGDEISVSFLLNQNIDKLNNKSNLQISEDKNGYDEYFGITMKNYGLMDSIWGLVFGMGLQVFNVILAVNFFKNLPVELEEACFIDGGGPWRNLISIYIPLAKPMVATISLFTIVQYWNEFFQGMVLSTKQSSYPLQTYIQQMVVTLDYSSMNVEQIAQAMKLNNQSLDAAKIFIAMIPVLIIYPFLQKYFVSGITLGSVKG